MIQNFGLIMICAMIPIAIGIIVAIKDSKKKENSNFEAVFGMKKFFVFVGIIVVIALSIVSYKLIASNNIKEKTYSHLETIGYTQNDIEDMEIKHSFINKVLGYNEWRIFVEFDKEPDIIFAFTYRDNQIIRQGITGKNTLLDKEEIHEYDRKFDTGELKNNQ